ncbi:MAG: MotA/TolQ/ExbB proton channel family protein [Candidatus Krumholzibacteriia bacterium]
MRPWLIVCALAVLAAAPAAAQDMRAAVQKAEADRQAALAEAKLAEERIAADRDSLTAAVAALEARRAALTGELTALEREQNELEARREDLTAGWGRRELGFREISGNVRLAARDLESLLKASPLSATDPERIERVGRLLDTGYFPDMEDIAGMADEVFDEIRRGGQVTLGPVPFVGRDGRETTGEVLQIGKFTAAYRHDGEVGFLVWSPEGRRLHALPELPPGGVRRAVARYMDGEAADAPVDVSGGAALRQATHRVGLAEQIRQGGPIVWPILLIALVALGIVVVKAVVLQRVHGNTDRLMGEVNDLAARGDWTAAEQLVDRHAARRGPVIAVLRAGLEVRGDDRETIESALQEAILRELPGITKGIALLAVLGAVAPLLGLLGTVTGMIDTFRVITLFGTGDPRLMSGGISEALVTTELGLAVAIPIMLLHSWLARRAEHIIGDMEEKAVRLTNIIQRQRAGA